LNEVIEFRAQAATSCNSYTGDLFLAISAQHHYSLTFTQYRERKTAENNLAPIFIFSPDDGATLGEAARV
jgi:hypothetical protein